MIKKLITLLFIFINISYGDLILNEKKVYESFPINYSLENIGHIKDIKDQNFDKSTNSNFALGYQKEIMWLKLDITNNSKSSKYILKLNRHFYEKVEIYYKKNNIWKKQKDGFSVPNKNKSYYSITPVFKLEIPLNEKRTYYIKIKTRSAKLGKFTLYEQNHFYNKEKSNIEFLFIFCFGVVLIIIIFTLFLVIRIKEKIYIYYLGYNIFYLIYIINQSGLLGYLDLAKYTDKIQSLTGIILVFLIYFSSELLNIKKYLPKTYQFLKIVAYITLIITPLFFIYHTPYNRIVNNLFAIVMIVLIVSAVYIYFKGNKNTKYYLFAIVLYFSLIIIYTIMINGGISYNFFTSHGYLLASIIETIIFSLLLATRYNDLKNRTIKIHKDLLNQRNKTKKVLQSEVKKQTTQIIQKNAKLESLVKERELLLKEVYHRVKNNFQVVISMLWFEGKKSPETKQSYLELINRIKSMSTVHEYLYNSKDLSYIQLDTYLIQIVDNLKMVYEKKDIQINTNIEKIDIEFNDAITLGVIVNEVLSNAIKHHNKTTKCIIDLNLNIKNGFVKLYIKDNGDGFDVTNPKQGIGLNLIKDFSKKFTNGDYKFSFENGTKFEMSFSN